MNVLIPPFWFSMRQGKAEAAGENQLRLTAPNLPESFLAIRQNADKKWVGAFRTAADGPDIAVSELGYDDPNDAWYAAYELYRTQVVV